MNQKDNKFTWGDAVLVKPGSPQKYRPGEFGSICGIDKITSPEEAKKLYCQKGEWIYIVEYEDGSSTEIPECYLNKDFSIIHGRELSKYNKCFINGVILGIIININCIEIEMKSTLINQWDSEDSLLLKDGFLVGKIIATPIENVTINNSSFSGGQKQYGTILEFEVSDHELKLLIKWERAKTSSFAIRSGQIWWKQDTNQIS